MNNNFDIFCSLILFSFLLIRLASSDGEPRYSVLSFIKSETILTAYQRLYVYAKIPNGNVPQEITQLYLFDEAVMDDFHEAKEATPLEAAFGIPAGYVEHIKTTDAKMFQQYRLTSTFDALSLEFYQMLERNIKLKRCKNCDKYFLVISKRNSDYCDRVFGEGTQTCQQLAAVKKFAEKNKENDAYKVFNKYYKR